MRYIGEIFNSSNNKESIGLLMRRLDYNIFSIKSDGLLKIENLKDFKKEENADYLFDNQRFLGEPLARLELATYALRMRCSTN